MIQSCETCIFLNWKDTTWNLILVIRTAVGLTEASLGFIFYVGIGHPVLSMDFCAVIEWGTYHYLVLFEPTLANYLIVIAFVFAAHILCFALDLVPTARACDRPKDYHIE